jgi:hypothetical protein
VERSSALQLRKLSRVLRAFDRAILGALALRIMTRTHALVVDKRRVVDGLSVGALARLFAVGGHARPHFSGLIVAMRVLEAKCLS